MLVTSFKGGDSGNGQKGVGGGGDCLPFSIHFKLKFLLFIPTTPMFILIATEVVVAYFFLLKTRHEIMI